MKLLNILFTLPSPKTKQNNTTHKKKEKEKNSFNFSVAFTLHHTIIFSHHNTIKIKWKTHLLLETKQ